MARAVASFPDPGGPTSIGIVILRNSEILKEWGKYTGLGTSNQAEGTAVWFGLRWLQKHNIHGATLVTDSRLICNLVTGKWKPKAPHLGRTNNRSQALMRATGTKIVWEPRTSNTLAHEAAERAMTPPAVDELAGRARCFEFLPQTKRYVRVKKVAA